MRKEKAIARLSAFLSQKRSMWAAGLLILTVSVAAWALFFVTAFAEISGSGSQIVAHLNFEEGSTSSTTDISGNGNTATLKNQAAWTSDAQIGDYAIVLDGSDDYAEIDDATELNATSSVTIAAWVKPVNGADGQQVVVSKPASASEHNSPFASYSFGVTDIGSTYRLWFLLSTVSSGLQFLVSTDTVDFGDWHHVAAVYDGTNVILYLDGASFESGTHEGTLNQYATPVRIGVNGALGQPYNGSVDEVRIYTRGLSGPEIAEIYAYDSVVALTVSKDGAGTGTVTSDIAGISCGGDCTENYEVGETVVLTAAPDGDSEFDGWSGGGCSGTGTCSLTFTTTTAVSVTASFSLADADPPVRSAGSPSGEQDPGTTSVTLSLTTDESATCKYGTTAGVAYASMSNTFSTTGGTSHSTGISGLTPESYAYHVRCVDGLSNANSSDYTIRFSIPDAGGGGLTAGGGSAIPPPEVITVIPLPPDFYGPVQVTEPEPEPEPAPVEPTPEQEESEETEASPGEQGGSESPTAVLVELQAVNQNLFYGVRNEEVRTLQRFLNAHGFFVAREGPGSPGNETDFFGPLTTAALRRFQDAYASQILIPAGFTRGTGYFGPNTRAFIQDFDETQKPAPVPTFTRPLTRGSRGDDVRVLQRLLGVRETGYFGTETYQAVLSFQLQEGLIASPTEVAAGYVGPKTREALNKRINQE